MAYCRWSDTSDVYCYAFYDYNKKNRTAWAVHTLKNDIETINYISSLKDLKSFFIDLKDKGFKFPETIFEQIDKEIVENKFKKNKFKK